MPVKILENVNQTVVQLFGSSITHVPEHTTDTVGSENIERIIVSESELELGRKIANCASQETESESGGCAEKQISR